ncbi:MAG TPA: orotidine-5'-phosphate decarboxylase [Acidisarcina sp.]
MASEASEITVSETNGAGQTTNPATPSGRAVDQKLAGSSLVDPQHRDRLPPERLAVDRLIVALDFASGDEALALVEQLDGSCRWFKVGLELYLAAGNSIVVELKRRGLSVFLDLKLHDIPNTVAGAVRSVARLGADLLTVHALGGPAMLAAAREAADSVPLSPSLLAVTILTSMDQAQLAAVGITSSPGSEALLLAQMAESAGISGVVCSPEELRMMRDRLQSPTLITPGIRPAGSSMGDQSRVATPASAIANGADYLVVGRPITRAANPAQAADSILQEIEAALQPRQ